VNFLTATDIEIITRAAVSSGLVFQNRMVLLGQIPMGFVASLTRVGDDLSQFMLDLGSLNRVERLEDGTVPLVTYLQAGATRLRLENKPESAVFERYASALGNRTHGIRLPSPATVPEVIRKEAIIHQDDSLEIIFLAGAATVSKSVARVSVPRFDNGVQRRLDNNRPWLMNGSGWMIGPDLFITNHHVINARTDDSMASPADFDNQALATTISFDFDTETSQTQTAKVAKVEAVDEPLDYAVVRLAANPQRDRLLLSTEPVEFLPSTYLPVNIIQHPQGKPKRIAFRNNLASGSDETSIRYFTDTDFGSSGSPVCNDSWRVLALHRGAIEVEGSVSFQGKETAYVNFGTRIDVLLASLKQRSAALYDEILLAQ
jgi:endonuclease G